MSINYFHWLHLIKSYSQKQWRGPQMSGRKCRVTFRWNFLGYFTKFLHRNMYLVYHNWFSCSSFLYYHPKISDVLHLHSVVLRLLSKKCKLGHYFEDLINLSPSLAQISKWAGSNPKNFLESSILNMLISSVLFNFLSRGE
jgi:hypothetical protein